MWRWYKPKYKPSTAKWASLIDPAAFSLAAQSREQLLQRLPVGHFTELRVG
jgi:hypothetical protein